MSTDTTLLVIVNRTREIRAASLQFAGKIGGFNKLSRADDRLFGDVESELPVYRLTCFMALEATVRPGIVK